MAAQSREKMHYLLSRNDSGPVVSLASVITCGTGLAAACPGSTFLCRADRVLGLGASDDDARNFHIMNRPASATATTSAANSANSARWHKFSRLHS